MIAGMRKISLIILVICAGSIFAQREEITIKVDTIYTPKSTKLKIVKVWSVPKFILHFNASYNSGSMELSGHNGGFSLADFSLGKTFGARHGFGANLIGKLPLSKKGNFWLDIIAGFDRFQSNLFASNTEEGKVYYNSFNGGIGAEYNFTPTHKMKYYIGLNPLVSVISGKSQLTNPDNNRIDVKIKSSVRIGYSAFVGFEYAFEKSVGLNVGLKFTHANLLLKKSEVAVQESDANSTMPLNDAAADEIQFAGWKQFAYFSGSVGFSYFFGVKEKRYKIPN
ncbi:MAG TPA: hypothetical protein VJ455_09235 [Ignavibacteria bacterium]|nr:hypothetical protein [Ignavibacteria bacterium]